MAPGSFRSRPGPCARGFLPNWCESERGALSSLLKEQKKLWRRRAARETKDRRKPRAAQIGVAQIGVAQTARRPPEGSSPFSHCESGTEETARAAPYLWGKKSGHAYPALKQENDDENTQPGFVSSIASRSPQSFERVFQAVFYHFTGGNNGASFFCDPRDSVRYITDSTRKRNSPNINDPVSHFYRGRGEKINKKTSSSKATWKSLRKQRAPSHNS